MDVSYSCAEQFMTAKKTRLLQEHHVINLFMTSPDPLAHKRIGRAVRIFDSVIWHRVQKDAVLAGTVPSAYTEPGHDAAPFEH